MPQWLKMEVNDSSETNGFTSLIPHNLRTRATLNSTIDTCHINRRV